MIKISKNTARNFFIDLISLIVGTLLMAISTALFLLPNKLSTGGFSGIATIAYFLFNLPVGTGMLILNFPLFALAFFRIGKKFIIKSWAGTLFLAFFINFFERYNVITTDRFLACIYGGILTGVGTAIILRANGSTGGSDLLSYVVRSYTDKLKNSDLIIIIDTVIIILNILVFKEIEIGLYSAIAIYLMGKLIDIIFEGVNFSKAMFIISNKSEEIARMIGEEVHRGSTGIYSKGMHTNKEQIMLLCVGGRSDVVRIKKIVLNIDAKAFITICNAREVLGKGFKK